MPGRDPEPKKNAPVRLGFLGRTRAMSEGGGTGWEATTIGFTLVGCIGAGAGLGYWLDNHLGTNYWLPILFLIGVVGGFREMFLVLGRISKDQQQKQREKQDAVQLAPNPMVETQISPAIAPRERIFKVPPPPVAGQVARQFSAEASSKKAEVDSESVDDLIEQLLKDEDKADGSDSETKR